MPGAFGYLNRVQQGVGITSIYATVGGMPLSNLLDPQPRTRARFIGVSESAGFGMWVTIDLLAQVTIEWAGVIGSTCDSALSNVLYRWRLSTADATGFAGDAWNTGNLAANTSAAANGNIIVLTPAGGVTGRYLQLEIHWHHRQEIDIGLIAAGPLWKLARADCYGITGGRNVLDRRDRNDITGAEFAVPAVVNPRFASFTLAGIKASEVASHRDMLNTIGGAEDGLWVPDTGLSQAELNLRGIWGGLAQPGATGLARTSFPTLSRSFTITERI